MNQNFLIGPIKEGLRKDSKPWAQPNDSFEIMVNAYQWRDRVVRRPGYKLLGRLANNTPVMGLGTRELFSIAAQDLIAFDTTNSYVYDSGSSSFIALPSFMTTVWSATDFDFFYMINYAGAFWTTNSKAGLHGYALTGAFAAKAGTGLTATVQVTAAGNNFVVGDFVYLLNVTGAAAANNLAYGVVTVAGNPTFTMMSLNPDPTFSFVNGAVVTGMVLSSTASKTNQDGIRFYGDLNYTGTTVHSSWANYNPPIDPNNALVGCLLMFAYKGYLVFLNTTEGNEVGVQNFPNRARWTQIGTPYYSYPVPNTPNLQTVDPNAARDDLFGRGGANDAPTNEVIVAAGFIRDILVVYFERSTWRLRFVNNSQNPFVWERVNVELGSDSTFSSIVFDKGLMAIGNRGIVISDSNDAVRFDQKIPDDIFNIRQKNNGFKRVHGTRTFRTKLNYWTYPSGQYPDHIYPDYLLVFNYDTQNWSFFDDTFTCLGYVYLSVTGSDTWNDLPNPWTSYNNTTASNGITIDGYETVIAGNQQGFVFELEQTSGNNDPSLYISAINTGTGAITSPNNNLPDGTWIMLTGVTGTTSSDGVSLNNRNFKISNPTDDSNNFTLNEFESIQGPQASGSSYSYTVEYVPVIPGSVQINIGSLQFLDSELDGVLTATGGSGTIDYDTGVILLNFDAPIAATNVFIRVVSYNSNQEIVPVQLTTAYTGGGLITKISNIDIQTKVFNFLDTDKRARLSKIDFYTDITENGQFICNIFADSSDIPVNVPLSDNLQSNVVLTTLNPYQVPSGAETMFRLYCDAIAQTLQFQFTLSDRQQAVTAINSEDIEINAFVVTMRPGGRLV